ncbi:MAG: NAD(P)H-binding protein [Planctomycetaceae bacterium]
MKVIVAGGSGFLGQHAVAELVDRGHQTVVLSRGNRACDDSDNVEHVACDVAAGQLPLDSWQGCDAIVNLIGIKREAAGQTFAAAHVDSTQHLIEAARQAGVQRFVHISVVAARPDQRHTYHDTKWQAEQLVRDSGLDFTILKPGVIYGPGDDMITHLVKMIRFCPVFPVVGQGTSILQPVSGADVARVIASTLTHDQAIGQTYDVVGPDPMLLREVVRTVAAGIPLNVWILPTPIWFQRAAVWAMNVVFRNPLSTPAQLQMLIDGLAGNPEAVARDLGVQTQPFVAERIAEVQASIPPLCGRTLRIFLGSGFNTN